jgi:hypothetical protein
VLGGRGGTVQSAAALLLAVPLGIVSLPATALLGLLRRGSSVTLWATRRG